MYRKAKFLQFFHAMCPAAESDMPIVLQGLVEIIYRVGAVAVLCKDRKNPYMIFFFLIHISLITV